MNNINLWAEIGVIFLMFSLGLEFSLHKLVKVGNTGVISALMQIGGMMLLGYGVGRLMGWSVMNSLFLGGILSMSSTMITIKAIEDLGLKEAPFTKLTIGTLVIEDIVAIFLMVILSIISLSQGVSGLELISTIGKLMFYLAVWLLLGISKIGRLILLPALQSALPNGTVAAVVTCVAVYAVMALLLPPMMIFRKSYFTGVVAKKLCQSFSTDGIDLSAHSGCRTVGSAFRSAHAACADLVGTVGGRASDFSAVPF